MRQLVCADLMEICSNKAQISFDTDMMKVVRWVLLYDSILKPSSNQYFITTMDEITRYQQVWQFSALRSFFSAFQRVVLVSWLTALMFRFTLAAVGIISRCRSRELVNKSQKLILLCNLFNDEKSMTAALKRLCDKSSLYYFNELHLFCVYLFYTPKLPCLIKSPHSSGIIRALYALYCTVGGGNRS